MNAAFGRMGREAAPLSIRLPLSGYHICKARRLEAVEAERPSLDDYFGRYPCHSCRLQHRAKWARSCLAAVQYAIFALDRL
jgi:hypothetical protein